MERGGAQKINEDLNVMLMGSILLFLLFNNSLRRKVGIWVSNGEANVHMYVNLTVGDLR
jgi:hypothetical protein